MHWVARCTTLSSVGPSQAIQACRGCWRVRNAIRYAQAAWVLLAEPVRVRLCFLDNEGRISLQEM